MPTIPIPTIDWNKLWPIFTRINILIVLDGRQGSSHYATFGEGDQTPGIYGDAYFGLSEVIDALTGIPIFSRFHITKAHRDTDVRGAADIEHFHFDEHDLSVYDEIWLIGVAPRGGTDTTMSESELFAIATFMDGGGGVFATGDHEDLGVELCGQIPRVRSMRKWYFPNPGPHGEPKAPSALDADRIDTTQPGHNDPQKGTVLFDDQSDDIPQPINLRWYTQSASVFSRWSYPHPLLCGPQGAITAFPDHMHEGEVIVPTDLSATFTFKGKQFVEYPKTGLVPTSPEIVAWGKVLPEKNVVPSGEPHTGSDVFAEPRMFGIVGAYDGHRERVGRVCVDSTWHHFFDINLIGDPAAPPPKTLGFKASPTGQAYLENIKNYYRNIGVWLARPATLSRHFAAGAWAALNTQPLNIMVRRGDYSLTEVLKFGYLARDALLRTVPPCSVLVFMWPQFVDGPVPVIPPDPWAGLSKGDPVIDPQVLLAAALGSAVVGLAQERDRIVALGVEEAVRAISESVRTSVVKSQHLLAKELRDFGEGLVGRAKEMEGEAGRGN
ncbi:hypothetical protein AB4Y44_27970 [Paraburkholderia sp. BR10937]|uniref:hypothetical protein n=1 Tax=Paraburkholderia sp. BR10937 TaxID=3236994 RepID=UPI0034D25630